MIINHNLSSIKAHQMLVKNQKNASKSMEKLSSGLRIGKAGDDAAGLSISEKMRAQIRGLNQASRNAQDAISMIQTSEGALQETHSLIQRMRELAVQAANDTNTGADREAIQKEINQLTSEVTRIGNDTEFNSIKLLNESAVDGDDATEMVSYLKKWWLNEASSRISNLYGLTPDNVSLKVIFDDNLGSAAALVRGSYIVDPTSSTGITGKGMNLELHINMAASQPVSGTNPGSFPQYVDRVIAHEMVHATMARTMNFGELPIWFKEGAAEFIHGADERLKYTIHNNGGGNTGLLNVVNAIGTGSQSDWAGTQEDYSVAYLAVRYLHEQIKSTGGNGGTIADSNGIKAIMSYLSSNQTKNLDDALADLKSQNKISFGSTTEWISAFKNDMNDLTDLNAYANVQLDNVFTPEADTGAIGGLDAEGGSAKTAQNIIPDNLSAPETEQPYSGFNIIWPITENRGNFSMQIGANNGQVVEFSKRDMRSKALGIAGGAGQQAVSKDGDNSARFSNGFQTESGDYALDVTSHEKATAAIKIYEEAIESVSSYRSELGAYQNRLEHTISNLNNSSEALTAAESRIRDADMAKEMIEYTKNNILLQVSQSILAQSNQLPQRILQLLA